jgi:hypothetical protein
MYVEQLVRFTMEGGKNPPARLGDLVSMRLERLQTDARRILQAVAVLGDETDPGQLLSIVQTADPDGAIEELRAAGMIDVMNLRISCAHPLIRDVVLGTIPRRREARAPRARGPPIPRPQGAPCPSRSSRCTRTTRRTPSKR